MGFREENRFLAQRSIPGSTRQYNACPPDSPRRIRRARGCTARVDEGIDPTGAFPPAAAGGWGGGK